MHKNINQTTKNIKVLFATIVSFSRLKKIHTKGKFLTIYLTSSFMPIFNVVHFSIKVYISYYVLKLSMNLKALL